MQFLPVKTCPGTNDGQQAAWLQLLGTNSLGTHCTEYRACR